jgi:hypothetical protein
MTGRSKTFVPAVHEVWCIGNKLCKIGVSNLEICRVMCKKENVCTRSWGKGHWYQTHCRVGLLWTTWQLLASSKAFFCFLQQSLVDNLKSHNFSTEGTWAILICLLFWVFLQVCWTAGGKCAGCSWWSCQAGGRFYVFSMMKSGLMLTCSLSSIHHFHPS